MDFSALYSDVNCPIKLSFVFANNSILPTNSCEDVNTCEVKKIKKWDSEKEKDLIGNIDRNKLDNLVNELDLLNSSILSRESINISRTCRRSVRGVHI